MKLLKYYELLSDVLKNMLIDSCVSKGDLQRILNQMMDHFAIDVRSSQFFLSEQKFDSLNQAGFTNSTELLNETS